MKFESIEAILIEDISDSLTESLILFHLISVSKKNFIAC